MVALENPEAATILDEIGNLYLNENFSDVTFVVGGEKLPAHRTILGQRCPVFKSMFLKPHVPGTLETISMNETPLDAFMVFLKFVYTGTVHFKTPDINFVFQTLQVAKAFEMTKLEQICIGHIKTVCTINNVPDIANEAIKKSDDKLVDHCLGYIRTNSAEFIKHGSFPKLSVKVLERVFQERTLKESQEVVFKSFVAWMKANPMESAQFPKLLKHIKLNEIALDDLVTAVRPLKLIDDKIMWDMIYEQAKSALPTCSEPVKCQDSNILTPQYGAEVVNGGYLKFFTEPTKGSTLKHTIGKGDDSIIIDLWRLFTLNNLVMELSFGDCSYWIEVSEDNAKWTRIIDYSKYICRSVQRLYFKERPVRYIRIHGTAPFNGTFEISRLEAHYAELPLQFDPETGIVEPSHNVALEENNAVVIQGQNSCGIRNGMLSGCILGLSYHAIGAEPIIVQLPQPYFLESMNLFLRRWSNLVYDYNIEISTDKETWTRIFKAKKQAGFQRITLDRQPVVFIKFTGTYASSAGFFDCQHLECPASTEK